MTSNHHAPYDLGYTRATNGVNKGKRTREGWAIQITSQFGLQSATRPHEAGIASNRDQNAAVNTFLVLYTPPVTPWESVTPEVSDLTAREELPKAGPMTGVKS